MPAGSSAGVTAPDPEGTPPFPVHQDILDDAEKGNLDLSFLDAFYEGYLVYNEKTETIMITHRGRAHLAELQRRGFTGKE
jgi:hypothetical protein